MNRSSNSKGNLNLVAIILFIALCVFLFWYKNSGRTGGSQLQNYNELILTKHAKCRMECRHISLTEIKEIIKTGKENYSKSQRGNNTIALEGYSNEGQHIRLVVAPENNNLVVVTCIDLDREWNCHCN